MSMIHARYEPIGFADLPGWAADRHLAAFEAFCSSASAMRDGVGLVAVGDLALRGIESIDSDNAAREFFETHFRPNRVVHFASAGLLTGYYEPVIEGSLVCKPPFTVPVYRRPADLENRVEEAERGARSGELTHVRRTSSGTEPYATRKQIELGALDGLGLELCFLADPIEAFFLHVQGSGAIRLPNGRTLRITYDGKNGHPYTSIGRTLIDEGVIEGHSLTLQTLGDWLRRHPELARTVLWRNESFVFFRALEGASPVGVLGTPLHAGRSLAIDTAFHALGLPIYVSAPTLLHFGAGGFHRLMVAHDVGSAIRGAERGDIYSGTGPEALALAGVTKHSGNLFVLLPVAAP